MESILSASPRTISKILTRLKLGCSECGWDKSICDIHHIVPKSKGGSDEHSNLTYLCPNCHRLAHRGQIAKFITLVDQIGDSWKHFYFPNGHDTINITKNGFERKDYPEQWKEKSLNALSLGRNKLKQECDLRDAERLAKLKSSNIDFSKYGWCQLVSEIIDISPQKVSCWLKRVDADFYNKCYRRNMNKSS